MSIDCSTVDLVNGKYNRNGKNRNKISRMRALGIKACPMKA